LGGWQDFFMAPTSAPLFSLIKPEKSAGRGRRAAETLAFPYQGGEITAKNSGDCSLFFAASRWYFRGSLQRHGRFVFKSHSQYAVITATFGSATQPPLA